MLLVSYALGFHVHICIQIIDEVRCKKIRWNWKNGVRVRVSYDEELGS